MFTTICLGWIGYQLSAPIWYFVLVAIRLFFNGYELCSSLYKAANKKG